MFNYPDEGYQCNYVWGTNTNKYLDYWCEIGANIVFVLPASRMPGIFTNLQYGESPRYSSKCVFLETRLSPAIETVFQEYLHKENQTEQFQISLKSDQNRALKIFQSIWTQLLFRGVYGFTYLYLAMTSLKYFCIRKRNGILNGTQLQVLVLNLVTNTAFGIVEIIGNKLISKALPVSLYVFFYTNCVGCTLAGDIWLSLMFCGVVKKNNHSNLLSERIFRYRKVFSCCSYIAICIDILCGISLQFLTSTFTDYVGIITSSVLAVGQVLVTLILYRQSTGVARILSENNKNTKATDRVIRILELKMRKCIRISVFSSLLNTIVLCYHAVIGIPYSGPFEWLSFWSLAAISNLGSSYAQIEACKFSKNKSNFKKVFSSLATDSCVANVSRKRLM